MSEVLEVRDFSGGVTDYPLNAALNKAETADNLLIERQGEIARFVLRPGSDQLGTTPQIPEGNQRVASLYSIGPYLLVHTSHRLYSLSKLITNPTFVDTAIFGGPFGYSSTDRTTTIAKFSPYGAIIGSSLPTVPGDSFPVLVYSETGTSAPKSQTAGLPKPNPIPTGVITAGGNNWLFKFVAKYTLSIGGNSVVMRSEPTAIYTALNASSVAFSAIPTTYTNSFSSYPTAPEIEVYRTIHNGTVFYYDGTVLNPSTTYSSTISDATLQGRAKLYTEGGVQPYSRPPEAGSVHTNGNLTYYSGMYRYESVGVSGGTIYQSVPGIPWGVPPTFYGVVDDDVIGVSSALGSTLAICKSSTHRVEGAFDAFGRGGMSFQRISDTSTCISAPGIVQTELGVFWAGYSGIYYCDGYRVSRVNDDYDKTWNNMIFSTSTNDLKRIQGKYDQAGKRVFWSIKKYDDTYLGSTDNDTLYVLDLKSGVGVNMPFTTWSGNDTSDIDNVTGYGGRVHFSATAIEVDPSYTVGSVQSPALFRATKNGIVHYHRFGRNAVTYDRGFDVSVPVVSNPYCGVKYTYRSPSFNFGSNVVRKLVTRINIILEYLRSSNSSISEDVSIYSVNDAGASDIKLDDIKRVPATVGTYTNFSFSSKWRHFVRTALRCVYKQVRIEPAIKTLDASTLSNLASISGETVAFPIALSAEVTQYSRFKFTYVGTDYSFRIIGISASRMAITLETSSGIITSGMPWTIVGYPKSIAFPVLSYAIHFTTLNGGNDAYSSSETNP